jgi:hypothetical protein
MPAVLRGTIFSFRKSNLLFGAIFTHEAETPW